MKKKMPKVGALRFGIEYGDMSLSSLDYPRTLKDAEVKARAEGYIDTPHDLAEFRRGWWIGICRRHIDGLRGLIRYLNRAEIAAMSDDLGKLYETYELLLNEGRTGDNDE